MIIKESNYNNDVAIKRDIDAIKAAGFIKQTVSSYGVRTGELDIDYEKSTDDIYMEIITMPDDGVTPDDYRYCLLIVGDGEDNAIQNEDEGWSIRTCLKVAKRAEQYFNEYPATRKYLAKFADEYDMDVL